MNYTLDCQSFLKKFKRCKCRLKTFIYTFLFHKFSAKHALVDQPVQAENIFKFFLRRCLKLTVIKRSIKAFLHNQAIMGAAFYNISIFYYQD